METLLSLIGSHGTRIIALALGTLTTLVATGIIPDAYAKYCMAAIAVLTYWRGQTTSNAFDKGVLVGNANATVPAPLPVTALPKVGS